MAIRIQLRRDTAENWYDANPILLAGEIGIETDTLKFKVGNGQAWRNISNYANTTPGDLTTTLDDYVLVADRGQADGVASLNSSGKIPVGEINTDVIATRTYVETVQAGLNIKYAAHAASTANIPGTYTAGSADLAEGYGVGATLTVTATGQLTLDGHALNAGERVLIKDQTDAKQNGIYVVTTAGSTGVSPVLTRSTDFDNSTGPEAKKGDYVYVINGTLNARDGFVVQSTGTAANSGHRFGTDSITFTQFSGAAQITTSGGITNINDNLSIDTDVITTRAVHDGYVNTTDGRLDSIDTTLGTLGNGLTDTNDDLAAAVSDITALQSDITRIDGDITSIQGDVSDIQSDITTINSDKAPKFSPTFTGTVVLPGTTSIGDVSSTELGYVNGVTSGIQAQIESKADASALSDHEALTTSVHGIADTSALATKTYADSAVSTHSSDTTSVHGIVDTSELATKTYANDAVTSHNNDTTSVHGIADTSVLLTTAGGTVDTLTITGNLTVNGTTTTVDTANLEVTDSLIYLSSEQFDTDTLDIGIFGAYGDVQTGHFHTGLVRDASDGKWKLISAGPEPVSNVIDFSGVTFDTLKLGGIEFSDGVQVKQGVPSLTPIVNKTASFSTDTLSFRDSMIEIASTNATTVTINPDGTNGVTYPIGTTFDILQTDTGQVTIAPYDGTVTVNATPGLKLRARWSSATLMKRDNNKWVVYGDLTA
jgi:hypothetical protein